MLDPVSEHVIRRALTLKKREKTISIWVCKMCGMEFKTEKEAIEHVKQHFKRNRKKMASKELMKIGAYYYHKRFG